MVLGKIYKKSVFESMGPFEIEKIRQKLAEKSDLKKLQTTYGDNIPEIENLNTASFWNERLNQQHALEAEDEVTQNRVKIASSFLPYTAKKILDIGVGYGFIEEILLKESREVEFYGNDISPIAIEYIKSRFHGKYKVESIYEMKHHDHFFDAVFLLEVLEHIPPSRTFSVLGDIKRLLKKGGFLILSVPMHEGLEQMKGNPNGHLRMYTEPLVMGELKIAGFEVLRYKTIYAFSSMYWLKSQIAKVWKRWQPNNIILLAKSV